MMSRFAGRLFQAWEGTNKATYSYLANSPLVDHITFANGGTTRPVPVVDSSPELKGYQVSLGAGDARLFLLPR